MQNNNVKPSETETDKENLTMEAANVIALDLIIAHIDYANALYAELPESDISKLQRIQNMTAKIVTGVNKYDSSTTALKTLHWLPLHLRIKHKVLTHVFRCVHGLAPGYLCALILSTRTNIKTGPSFRKQGCHSASAFHETQAVC